jgi:hypothetical protein
VLIGPSVHRVPIDDRLQHPLDSSSGPLLRSAKKTSRPALAGPEWIPTAARAGLQGQRHKPRFQLRAAPTATSASPQQRQRARRWNDRWSASPGAGSFHGCQ